ncbi:endonuclease III [Candidatus Peregrinibacteria bacterium]|nr:endonuclease III [Candidatus Peregrinibacteria bacterium]
MEKLSKKALKKAQSDHDFIYKKLKTQYPNSITALNWENPLQLLIATILSAQCTDARVNMVTPELFNKYPTANDLAEANPEKVQKIIRSTGFYKSKTRSIIGACKKIIEEFNGKMPDNINCLIKLPGVARKTANVVLWNVYGKNEGIVVDTHVKRVAYRLGWTTQRQPEKVEKDLMKIFKKSQWGPLSHLLIDLGREYCKAPMPKCEGCFLKAECPWYAEIISKK